MKALLFDIDRYDRGDLDWKNENELYELAMKGEGYATQVMSLDEFQEALNDEAVDVDGNWVYFIH